MNRAILPVAIAGIIAATAMVYFFAQPAPEGDEALPGMADAGLPETVDVGVLLPATGDLSSHGADNSIATRLAASDFNDYLEEEGASWRINLVVEDTQTDPIVALEKIQSLNSKGIKMIIGTETSAELRNVKSYSETNGMLLISPSSTSPALAIDDNIFRLIPDDTKQGKVLATLFEHEGIEVVIPIYRADVWGDGLYESTRESFEGMGGIVDDGIRYSPEVAVFSTEASLLSDRVAKYSESYPRENIAILIISFSEAVHLLNSANSYDNLHDLRWFGADALSNDDEITEDPISSALIESTGFISTQSSASKNAKYEHVRDHLIEQTGSSPNNYAYSSYDGLWVLGLAIDQAQSTDADVIKEILPDVAAGHTGSIGQIRLNEFGDLAISDYELWAVADGQWVLHGYYNSTDGSITIH